jgi:deoxyribonuclease-4
VPHFFGAHTHDAGGIHMAVRRAARSRMRALQVFTALPQYYNEKVRVKPERVQRFGEAVSAAGLDRRRILVHAGYVLNTASPEPEKQGRAQVALARELERTTAFGVLGCCFHPGSAGASDPAGAIERIAGAMTHALESVQGSSRILIENTAGAGRTMGRTAEEIAGMLALVPVTLRHRAGYGLDTCHLFASGHDLTTSKNAVTGIIDRFTDVIGEAPSFFHLNDSEGALGSNRDRHALLGEGRIGVEPFRWLLEDPRSHDVPLILETPQQAAPPDDDDSPDANDARMIDLLERLSAL